MKYLEWRLNNWYHGDGNFKVGTRCLVKVDGSNFLHCYIQKLSLKDEPCKVYIEELAEFKNVDYKQLEPVPDAQPWSLPYRYASRITQDDVNSKDKGNFLKRQH